MIEHHTLYMRLGKKHALKVWYEKHAFYHPGKALCLHYILQPVHLNSFFSKRTFNARYSKHVLQNALFKYVT